MLTNKTHRIVLCWQLAVLEVNVCNPVFRPAHRSYTVKKKVTIAKNCTVNDLEAVEKVTLF